jgi:chemotaxis protein MotA
MKAASAIGIAAAIGGLAMGALMEGSKLPAFFNVPAMLIVFGGTFGATLAATSMEAMKRIPQLYKRAFQAEPIDLNERVELMVRYAERARRDGLLALDEEVSQLDDEFTRKGLQLVVDGTDPELVREILENDMDGMAGRHEEATRPFTKAGGFAPTMGILGTVMGLVHVLENLDAPETLGPAISGAFIATLYGVASANIVFLPVADKLKALSEEEMLLRTITLEGVLAIQAGDNPRIVADKLLSFVPPAERREASEKPAQTEAAPVAEAAAEAA